MIGFIAHTRAGGPDEIKLVCSMRSHAKFAKKTGHVSEDTWPVKEKPLAKITLRSGGGACR
jgi:hypothetical protein